MICSKCGKAISEDSRFCSGCGVPVQRKEEFCSCCGQKLSPGVMFCTNCGTKQSENTGNSAIAPSVAIKTKTQGNHSSTAPSTTVKISQTGGLLREIKLVTKFYGEPAVGLANKGGTLRIYEDRVEFTRNRGLTFVGSIAAAMKSEVETYYYSDCLSVTNGVYMAAFVTLVLNLRNGQKVSFCPIMPVSREMETVANMMMHYIE